MREDLPSFKEVQGDLFKLVDEHQFDVIAHGCNCFCTMKAGIAVEFNKRYNCNRALNYGLEGNMYAGDINKLGQIQARNFVLNAQDNVSKRFNLTVINCYTQYHYSYENKPFNQAAFEVCLHKINHKYAGLRIGLPLIGGHLAGGVESEIKEAMKRILVDCYVTLVLYKP